MRLDLKSDGPDAAVLGSSVLGILRRLTNSDKQVDEIERALAPNVLGLQQWTDHAQRYFPTHPLRHHFNLPLAIAFLRDPPRQGIRLSNDELEAVWCLIRTVLTETTIANNVTRKAQGNFDVFLWCLREDGKMVESLKLQVLLPTRERLEVIHSLPFFAQTWVLFGEAMERHYHVQPCHRSEATHTVDGIGWKSISSDEMGDVDNATIGRAAPLA
ncbi:hypothetical protein GGTG_07376 [Gaeumannomyces tritici R3-111a-1]|uniref:Uncharacterized protein n=1 Tax=Gaeumannomyces tritici (strain R3-111a-1) TaxID=644352 RepID=J3P1H9_GAET3|nr:hypothetical protein GGTG_07376 [Gaeumannomyces tritici R3-111a-1]EJT77464.1 hypothetical protein GGTG_07376 [Gaeumannomyces tritici R3-111a-1]